MLEQYARPQRMPLFLIESAYENEHEVTERRLRTQAYHALLCGAAGQVFGNNPVWHFNGPGLYPTPVTWQEALDSRGARSMTHLRALLAGMSWWLLEPDSDNSLLVDGSGPEEQQAVAARARDRSFAMSTCLAAASSPSISRSSPDHEWPRAGTTRRMGGSRWSRVHLSLLPHHVDSAPTPTPALGPTIGCWSWNPVHDAGQGA